MGMKGTRSFLVQRVAQTTFILIHCFLRFIMDLGIVCLRNDFKAPPLMNDITFLYFENVNRIYALRNDIYAASPFLRINVKKQRCCL